ncbi:MAG TPA: hypothetical protein VH351_07455 [Bryobacteraceae bacterium]|nr:hypothetical protein [Bryobacteraceae bacterium]
MQNPNFRFSRLSAAAVFWTVAACAAQKHPGDQNRWSLDLRVRLEQAEQRPAQVRLSGHWVSTVSAVRAGEYDLQLQLSDLQFSDEGGSTAGVEQLRRALERPFWATYRENGELMTVHFYKDVEPSQRNLLQMIATETQSVAPDAARGVWTVLERDGAGTYLALYQQADARTVMKHKLKYIYTDGVAGAPADMVRAFVDESEVRFSLDAAGLVREVNGANRVRMDVVLGEKQSFSTATAVHLSLLQTTKAEDLIGSLDRVRAEIVTFPVVTQRQDHSEIRARKDERLLQGHSTEDLLKAAGQSEIQDSELPERLSALFRHRPDAITSAVKLLQTGQAQTRLTIALGRAATPAAVDALSSLARDQELPAHLRIEALNGFVQTQRPLQDAMRVPLKLMDDPDSGVRSAARIVAGAMARAGRAEHPQEAEELDSGLLERYRAAEDVASRCNLLAALGNSVGAEVVPVIEKATGDSQNAIRATAARALRLAQGDAIDRLLAAAITSDSAANVRADALFAVRFRPAVTPPLGEALVQAATTDAVEYLRSDAIGLLRQHPDASPHTLEALKRIAEKDCKPAIRRQAADALEAINGKPG